MVAEHDLTLPEATILQPPRRQRIRLAHQRAIPGRIYANSRVHNYLTRRPPPSSTNLLRRHDVHLRIPHHDRHAQDKCLRGEV